MRAGADLEVLDLQVDHLPDGAGRQVHSQRHVHAEREVQLDVDRIEPEAPAPQGAAQVDVERVRPPRGVREGDLELLGGVVVALLDAGQSALGGQVRHEVGDGRLLGAHEVVDDGRVDAAAEGVSGVEQAAEGGRPPAPPTALEHLLEAHQARGALGAAARLLLVAVAEQLGEEVPQPVEEALLLDVIARVGQGLGAVHEHRLLLRREHLGRRRGAEADVHDRLGVLRHLQHRRQSRVHGVDGVDDPLVAEDDLQQRHLHRRPRVVQRQHQVAQDLLVEVPAVVRVGVRREPEVHLHARRVLPPGVVARRIGGRIAQQAGHVPHLPAERGDVDRRGARGGREGRLDQVHQPARGVRLAERGARAGHLHPARGVVVVQPRRRQRVDLAALVLGAGRRDVDVRRGLEELERHAGGRVERAGERQGIAVGVGEAQVVEALLGAVDGDLAGGPHDGPAHARVAGLHGDVHVGQDAGRGVEKGLHGQDDLALEARLGAVRVAQQVGLDRGGEVVHAAVDPAEGPDQVADDAPGGHQLDVPRAGIGDQVDVVEVADDLGAVDAVMVARRDGAEVQEDHVARPPGADLRDVLRAGDDHGEVLGVRAAHPRGTDHEGVLARHGAPDDDLLDVVPRVAFALRGGARGVARVGVRGDVLVGDPRAVVLVARPADGGVQVVHQRPGVVVEGAPVDLPRRVGPRHRDLHVARAGHVDLVDHRVAAIRAAKEVLAVRGHRRAGDEVGGGARVHQPPAAGGVRPEGQAGLFEAEHVRGRVDQDGADHVGARQLAVRVLVQLAEQGDRAADDGRGHRRARPRLDGVALAAHVGDVVRGSDAVDLPAVGHQVRLDAPVVRRPHAGEPHGRDGGGVVGIGGVVLDAADDDHVLGDRLAAHQRVEGALVVVLAAVLVPRGVVPVDELVARLDAGASPPPLVAGGHDDRVPPVAVRDLVELLGLAVVLAEPRVLQVPAGTPPMPQPVIVLRPPGRVAVAVVARQQAARGGGQLRVIVFAVVGPQDRPAGHALGVLVAGHFARHHGPRHVRGVVAVLVGPVLVDDTRRVVAVGDVKRLVGGPHVVAVPDAQRDPLAGQRVVQAGRGVGRPAAGSDLVHVGRVRGVDVQRGVRVPRGRQRPVEQQAGLEPLDGHVATSAARIAQRRPDLVRVRVAQPLTRENTPIQVPQPLDSPRAYRHRQALLFASDRLASLEQTGASTDRVPRISRWTPTPQVMSAECRRGARPAERAPLPLSPFCRIGRPGIAKPPTGGPGISAGGSGGSCLQSEPGRLPMIPAQVGLRQWLLLRNPLPLAPGLPSPRRRR